MTARVIKADRHPQDPGPAAWNEILPPARNHPRLEGTRTADVAVIGAGFAGLSAARRMHLQDPSLKLAILEARRVGEGPAGRNSGFMIDLPHHLASSDYAGEHDRDRLQTTMNRSAIAFARDASGDYAMPQEALVQSGKVNAAAGSRGIAHNIDYAAHLKDMGEPFELLDRSQMRELCGSSYYESGLYTPGTAILQPALYVRSLATGLTRDGISVFENSPVTSLEREGAGWRLTTPDGSISANRVILGVNGHVESFGFYRRRLIHIYLHASMTRALTDEEINSLGGASQWAFTPSDPLGSTVRRISGAGGARIIIRNGISWAPGRKLDEARIGAMKARHDRTFRARFPMLANAGMEYRWGGLLCMSMNAAPAFGEVEPGLYSACCQNGLGTAFGTLSGMAAADLVLGIESRERSFMQSQDSPSLMPPEPIAGIGARLRFWWGERVAGPEL